MRAGSPPVLAPHPRERAGRGARGFTLFERVICLLVISVLAGALLDRLYYYQGLAEQAAMASTARVVAAGLHSPLAQLIIANYQSEAVVPELADPVRWLEAGPLNLLKDRVQIAGGEVEGVTGITLWPA